MNFTFQACATRPARRTLLALGFSTIASMAMSSRLMAADDVAGQFVQENINKGLAILNDSSLSPEARRDQFASFLLGITDVRRIALFTLGQYRRDASPADVDAFVNAFRNYALAVYQSYFSKYSGQQLKVISSHERAPGDYIVSTNMIDPNSSEKPLQIDFRVRTDGGNPVLVDFAVQGIWIALEERDEFVSFLGQNNGSIPTLISHLDQLATRFKS